VYENLPVHVVESVDVHAQGLGHARHVQPKRLEKRQEVNVLTCKGEKKVLKYIAYGYVKDIEILKNFWF
jgi:hypothetical protein